MLDLTYVGSAFHKSGAAAEKDPSPQDLLVLVSWSCWALSEHRPGLEDLFSTSRSDKYTGVWLILILKTMGKYLVLESLLHRQPV